MVKCYQVIALQVGNVKLKLKTIAQYGYEIGSIDPIHCFLVFHIKKQNNQRIPYETLNPTPGVWMANTNRMRHMLPQPVFFPLSEFVRNIIPQTLTFFSIHFKNGALQSLSRAFYFFFDHFEPGRLMKAM